MLVFQPVHSSVRSLAMSVDNFEKQGENILVQSSKKNRGSTMMDKVCNSLNHISLAIQALPLLHLAGYTSPRDELVIGHSAVALPVLLSEVYVAVCASTFITSTNVVSQTMRWNNKLKKNIDAVSEMHEKDGNNNHDKDNDDNDNEKGDVSRNRNNVNEDQQQQHQHIPSLEKRGHVSDDGLKEGKMKLWDEEDEVIEANDNYDDNADHGDSATTDALVTVKPKLIKIGFISGKKS